MCPGQVCVPAAEDGRTEQMKASRERRMGGEIERDTEREREREKDRGLTLYEGFVFRFHYKSIQA